MKSASGRSRIGFSGLVPRLSSRYLPRGQPPALFQINHGFSLVKRVQIPPFPPQSAAQQHASGEQHAFWRDRLLIARSWRMSRPGRGRPTAGDPTPQIAWEVKGPFPLFRKERDLERQLAAHRGDGVPAGEGPPEIAADGP